MTALARAAAIRLSAFLIASTAMLAAWKGSLSIYPEVLIAVAVTLIVSFFVRQRLAQYWAESRWDEWLRTASGLAWRDRWELFRATVRGRSVVDPRLADLAVQRAERLSALLDAGKPGRDVSWPLLGAAVALMTAGLMLVQEREAWSIVAYAALLVIACLTDLLVNRRRARRAQRCIRVNRGPAGMG
ncbi:hypothetical protein [Streptomyces sp. NPDC002133]|uniref:hypothetical protein n=1 Tax=Streptomyces sp. NPDC002133 TaxID=3154409 RepID=UPI003332266E